MCQESFFEFFLHFWSEVAAEKLRATWYIKKLCDELQVVSERVFRDEPRAYDLIWNCPPGTTKSSVVSVLWQPWAWTRMPSARFITGSFSERLALDLSRKSRDVVQSERYRRLFPHVQLREDQNTKGYFANTSGGIRYAVGVGGSVIGMHAHFLAVDDPVDPTGALSDLILAESNTWMAETLSRRKVNAMLTPTVLIMQRLHQDDPTGSFLARGTRVRHFCVPGDDSWEIKPPELKEFYEDGLLDPQRLPREALEEAFETLGETGYAGQYGQQPTPRGGALFKIDMLNHAPIPPRRWKRGPIRFWDKACLVAGTQIKTLNGFKVIEEIQPGDMVLTREGFRAVKWAGQTGYTQDLSGVLFSDGSFVMGTPDHLVWDERLGWTPIVDACSMSNALGLTQREYSRQESRESVCPAPRFRCSTASVTPVVRAGGISTEAGKTLSPGAPSTSQFTRRCGDFTRVIYPLVTTHTTVTGTQATTTLKILSAPHTEIICESIGGGGRLTQTEKWLARWLHGHKPQRGARCRSATAAGRPGRFPHANYTANCVTRSTPARHGTPGRGIALRFAGWSETGGVPVYDITVSRKHEFFANGVLVHNCTQGGGAYTAGVLMAVHADERLWVLDSIRGQWDTGRREQRILDTADLDGKGVMVGIEQEPGSGGKESAEATQRRTLMKGHRCRIVRPTGDKELRAEPYSQLVNMGKVVLLKGAWNQAYLEEMRFFPRSKYKDQIDASSGCLTLLTSSRYRIGAL